MSEKLVEEHAAWFTNMMVDILDVVCSDGAVYNRRDILRIMERVYHDSMLHGYKHGFEDGDKRTYYQVDVCPDCYGFKTVDPVKINDTVSFCRCEP